ncbi:MAG: amino acid-binding protein [Candidatus Auribacterota bacterium]|jgi:hypothetical protein|nr:amino acid-binding protein [Candidatus Auribacterota bacterium]
MKVQQLSIFLENKLGRLLETTEVLAQHDINIRAMSLAETKNFGIVRLIVENTSRACDLLRMHNFTVEITEVIAVEVNDTPGELARVLRTLHENELNVEYAYAFVERKQNKAVVIIRMDQIDRAISVLKAEGIKTLTQQELYL